MFNDQVMQRRSLHFQAELEQQRASALLDSYTAQRRLTHEFTLSLIHIWLVLPTM